MKRILLCLMLLAAWGAKAGGEHGDNIVINEILVVNNNDYTDEYGHRSGWVELFNPTHTSIDVGGWYFTTDKGNSMTYLIPAGDKRTVIGPKSYMMFFFDGATANKGIFHTSLTLDKTGYLALYDSGFRTLIDEVTYNAETQLADVSLGRVTTADEEVVFTALGSTTPMFSNEAPAEIPRHEQFRRVDPNGFMMTITAVVVVFTVLALLSGFFIWLGRFMVRLARKKSAESKGEEVAAAIADKTNRGVMYHNAEVVAAIGLAMKLYQEELHDRESTVITINKVNKFYSPWSSKLYGLRQLPPRKK